MRTSRSSAVIATLLTAAVLLSGCATASAKKKPKTTKVARTTKQSSKESSGSQVSKVTTKPPVVSVAGAAESSAKCEPIRVMPLGDSLTAFPDSYRGPLYRSLKAAGWNVDFVGSGKWEPTGGGDADGEGHGGFRIGPDPDFKDYQGNPASLAEWVGTWIPASNPEVIVLNIGTNDIAAGGEVAVRAPAHLTALIAQLRSLAPTAQILVGDLPPGNWVPNGTPETAALGKAAKAAGEAEPKFVTFMPIFDRMRADGFDPTPGVGTTDNTHFTVSGGIAFAKVLEPSVVAAMQRVRRC
jgi:GDSL-like Lipase/Acylhydrolase family